MTGDTLTVWLVFVLGMGVGALCSVLVIYHGLATGRRTVRGYDLVKKED